jgi:hypothetical protein
MMDTLHYGQVVDHVSLLMKFQVMLIVKLVPIQKLVPNHVPHVQVIAMLILQKLHVQHVQNILMHLMELHH